MAIGKDYYTLMRTHGGLSLDYDAIIESDFAGAAGPAYTPPEENEVTFRRVVAARTIQLLAQCPGVVETFQSSDAVVRLPASTVSDITDDAGNGRLFFLKNSGTANSKVTVQDYLGAPLYTVYMGTTVIVVGNQGNQWDFYLNGTDYSRVTYEPTGFVNTRYDSVTSFNEGSRMFSISPVSSSYEYMIRGVSYVKSGTDTVFITDTDGPWFIFYAGTVLTASQTPWTFTDPIAFVAVVYWNVADQKATLINDERHGLVMDWATHRYNHYVSGLEMELYKFTPYNYVLRGDGTSDSHAQLGFTDLGWVFDEDLDFTPINSATPTNPYEQKIGPILNAPVIYRSGAAGTWRNLPATAFPLAWNAGQRASYNQWTGATWQLTQATEGYFFNMYPCLTNDPRNPFIVICGQNEYSTIVDAAAKLFKDLSISLATHEMRPLCKLIFKTSSTFTNQPKTVLYALLPIGEAAVDNDRYTVEMNYGGNAGTGKYLDRTGGSSSFDNPFSFPEASFIRYMILQNQRGALATGTVGVFKTTDLVNPVISISLNNEEFKKRPFSQYFTADEQIALRVTSGSINKPYVTIWIQTQLG